MVFCPDHGLFGISSRCPKCGWDGWKNEVKNNESERKT
jgi:hypothetical protein